MPISITWNYRADECPPIPTWSDLPDPAGGNPPVATELASAGMLGSQWRAAINEAAARADYAHRYGGGAWCVAQGLLIGDGGGLLGSVADGMALIDGEVYAASLPDVPLLAGAQHLWIAKTADVSTRTDLLLPAGAAAYLGRITTDGAAVTELDKSGVLEMRGGTLYRRTADAGAPADAPPSTLQFLAETLGGRYWWTGSEYVPVWEPLAMYADPLPSGVKAAIPAGYKMLVGNGYTIDGQLAVDGTLLVLSE